MRAPGSRRHVDARRGEPVGIHEDEIDLPKRKKRHPEPAVCERVRRQRSMVARGHSTSHVFECAPRATDRPYAAPALGVCQFALRTRNRGDSGGKHIMAGR